MSTVNMHEAKTRLSQLVDAVQSGAEREVVIARNGVPAARLMPLAAKPKLRWGLAKGKYVIPDDIDELNPEIEKLFNGEID
jgi:prevent-host-death family protein